MFQNIDEAGLYSYFTTSPPTPALTMTDASSHQKLAELSLGVASLEAAGEELRRSREACVCGMVKFVGEQRQDSLNLA